MDNNMRVSRLLKIFQDTAGSWTTQTKPFDRWDESTRMRLLAEANVQSSELPFIAYVGENEWTILSLTHIVSKTADQMQIINITDITDASIPDHLLARLTPEVKRNFSQLKLVEKSGEIFQINFEPGSAFIGFWNTVKTMIKQNNRHTE